ncbi:AsmA2 domain-containing protein YhdP [Proteus hauseri]|uniref:AsmA2 domain-containing protein YhdP n=1 Tax=Proteus hauseri TaxID=183417 RepID=UPI0032DAE985
MKRLPKYLLLTTVFCLIVFALILSGFRYFLPRLDNYRPEIEAYLTKQLNSPVSMTKINGEWQNFGPDIQVEGLHIDNQEVDVTAEKVTFSFDAWRSLLTLRLHFRELTFEQLYVDYHSPIFTGQSGDITLTEPDNISSLFLEQFDRFNLVDSRFTFLTPSGDTSTLNVPELIWLNQKNRHRAQGEVTLDTLLNHYGGLKVRLDLYTKDNGLIDNGNVFITADDIDISPWLSKWVKSNSGLGEAKASLSNWIEITQGRITGSQLQIHQGVMDWQSEGVSHVLNVEDLILRMRRQENGWLADIPYTRKIAMDGKEWPDGYLAVLYQPKDNKNNEEWRIRAKNIELERLYAVLPLFSFLTPDMAQRWQHRHFTGIVNNFALDLTPSNVEQSAIDMDWQNVSWKQWKALPSVEHFNGHIKGSMQGGELQFTLANSKIDTGGLFKAPLNVGKGAGTIYWQYKADDLSLWSQGLDIKATSAWVTGDFRYEKKGEDQQLSILSGVSVSNAGDTWRYLPEQYVGENLTQYLSGAIIAGNIDNATFIFHGDPVDFPFEKHNGWFQVYAPVKQATFKFDSEWPALFDLDINLDFRNKGLWMSADNAKVGKALASNLTAVISDYAKEKIVIDANIAATGDELKDYFLDSQMASIGHTLEELKVAGNINGTLKLDIPFGGEDVVASGDINLKNNDVTLAFMDTTLKGVTGQFRYNNDKLESDTLTGSWLGQPLTFSFTSHNNSDNYQVDVGLKGQWNIQKIQGLPSDIQRQISGVLPWNGTVKVNIPEKGDVNYQVNLTGNVNGLASQLTAPETQDLKTSPPIMISAKGNSEKLTIDANAEKQWALNSEWALGKQLRLLRANLASSSIKRPKLPEQERLTIELKGLNGDKWLPTLVAFSALAPSENEVSFPDNIHISLPELNFAGQTWRDQQSEIMHVNDGVKFSFSGSELRGDMFIPTIAAPWQININYLYFNGEHAPEEEKRLKMALEPASKSTAFSVTNVPSIEFECKECWVNGLLLGKIKASMQQSNGALFLTEGKLENSSGQLSVTGVWSENAAGQNNTKLSGKLNAEEIDEMAAYFGYIVPIIQSPLSADFSLQWHNTPWNFDLATLNGEVKSSLGKGRIEKVNVGQAGKLLRLVSFDALLRKLQFDFRDTFSDNFEYDSIKSEITIKQGVMNADSVRIDGVIADIVITGQVDLLERKMDLQVVVTPEISATVGVATAFAINPIAGAAVFAASKVLGPLWSKISVIRYHVTGTMEQPKIDEVLRQLKENQAL